MIKKLTWSLLFCAMFPQQLQAESLLAINNPAANQQLRGIYTSNQSFAANDQVALQQYGGDWQGEYSPRDGTNLGLLSIRTESGVQGYGYRLGLLKRAEAMVEANRDASDLVQQYNNLSGYDVGRVYQFDIRVKGFEADGARVSKSFQFEVTGWQLSWGLGLSYLHGTRIKLETVTGQAVTLNSLDVNASAHLNDTDSNINITDLEQFNAPYGRMLHPYGQGYALDAGVVLQRSEKGLKFEMAVADLAGSMSWINVPNNVADIDTANKYYDANGYVHYNASATRTSSYKNLTMGLDPKLWLAMSYPGDDYEVQVASNFTNGYWLPQAGVKYQFNPEWAGESDYDFRFKTLGMSIRHKWILFGLRADSLNLDKAKAYGFNIALNIPL